MRSVAFALVRLAAAVSAVALFAGPASAQEVDPATLDQAAIDQALTSLIDGDQTAADASAADPATADATSPDVPVASMSIGGRSVGGMALSGQTLTTKCTTYTGWSGDGCVTANGTIYAAAYYGAASFYALAAQSGQQWSAGAHPWTWNSPGIDYGVGPTAGVKLADPAFAQYPDGCFFNPYGSPLGGAEVHCGVGAVNPVLNGLDFSLRGCTVFQADANVVGTVTISNSKFVNGPNCSMLNGYMIKVISGSVGLVLKNDLIDEAYPKYKNMMAGSVVVNTIDTPLTILNSAILNTSSRPISGTSYGALDIENSVFVGMTLVSTANSGQHGELYLMGSPVQDAVYPSITYRNNVVVIPASTAMAITTPFYANGLTGKNNVVTNFVVDHNVVVTNYAGGVAATQALGISGTVSGTTMTVNSINSGSISLLSSIVSLPAGGAATILSQLGSNQYALSGKTAAGTFSGANTFRITTAAALAEMAVAASYGTVTITNNYVDPTGALSCVQNFGGAIGAMTMAGNQSLVTGGVVGGIGYKAAGATCPPLY